MVNWELHPQSQLHHASPMAVWYNDCLTVVVILIRLSMLCSNLLSILNKSLRYVNFSTWGRNSLLTWSRQSSFYSWESWPQISRCWPSSPLLLGFLYLCFIFTTVLCHGLLWAGLLSVTLFESAAAIFNFIDFFPACVPAWSCSAAAGLLKQPPYTSDSHRQHVISLPSESDETCNWITFFNISVLDSSLSWEWEREAHSVPESLLLRG